MELRASAALFDLDGTLVDSTALITRAWTEWAMEQGLTRESFAGVVLHGRPARDIVHELLPGWEEEALRRIVEIEVSAPLGVTPLPGAAALLRALGARDWAVVTSGSQRVAEPRVAALPVVPPVLVTADDVRRGKPDPEPYLLGARRLGIDPGRCVVVEDAPSGLAAAAAAGMRSIAVTTTHQRQELAADAVVTDLRAVGVRREGGGLVLIVSV